MNIQNIDYSQFNVWPEYDEQAIHQQHQFCDDMTCRCHTDTDLISDLNRQYQDGLASVEDADRIYRGQVV